MVEMKQLLDFFNRWLLSEGVGTIAVISLILAGILIASRSVKIFVRHYISRKEQIDPDDYSRLERFKRLNTLVELGGLVLKILIWLMGAMLILERIGIDVKPILAGAGIAGLAVGFGAQSLVKDIIAGIFVLVEDQFRVGDVIKAAGGTTGAVEKMTLRSTVLRDFTGQVHFIPNGGLGVVTNMTRDFSTAVVDVAVAYKEKIDRVIEVIAETARELEKDSDFNQNFIEPITIAGVQELGDSAVVIRCLLKMHPGKHWQIAREFRKRVKNRFEEVGIEIPFPQRTVHLRAGG